MHVSAICPVRYDLSQAGKELGSSKVMAVSENASMSDCLDNKSNADDQTATMTICRGAKSRSVLMCKTVIIRNPLDPEMTVKATAFFDPGSQ